MELVPLDVDDGATHDPHGARSLVPRLRLGCHAEDYEPIRTIGLEELLQNDTAREDCPPAARASVTRQE